MYRFTSFTTPASLALMLLIAIDRTKVVDALVKEVTPVADTSALQKDTIQQMLDEYHHRIETDLDFPAFHVRPPKNWNNDPNGPMRFPRRGHGGGGGEAHLWMQYNPDAAVWGNMSWWHATSTDGLVHWLPVGVSLYNDAEYDLGGVFSGSATLVPGSQLGLGPNSSSLIPVITYTCVKEDKTQLQCLAYPLNASDPLLKDWVKDSSNPVIGSIPSDEFGKTSFRDPTTAWQGVDEFPPLLRSGRPTTSEKSTSSSQKGSNWTFATATVIENATTKRNTASIVLWTKDSIAPGLGQWSRVGGAGKGAFFQDETVPSETFECPDVFFAEGQDHQGGEFSLEGALSGEGTGASPLVVLKTSIDGLVMDYYRIGTVKLSEPNSSQPVFLQSKEAPFAARYDYGDWYASKTFWDPVTNRRILWGWIRELNGSPAPERGWASTQSLPRVVEFDSKRMDLRIYPLPELAELRSKTPAEAISNISFFEDQVSYPIFSGNCTLATPDCFQQEIEVNLAISNNLKPTSGIPFELGVRVRGGLFVGVTYTGDKVIHKDKTQFLLPRTYSFIQSSSDKDCATSCYSDPRCNAWTFSSNSSFGQYPWMNCALAVFAANGNASKALPWPGRSSGLGGTNYYFQAGTIQESWSEVNPLSNTPAVGRTSYSSIMYNATHSFLSLRVFVDRSVIEAFKDGGQDRLSTRYYSNQQQGLGETSSSSLTDVELVLQGGLSRNRGIEVINATVWNIETIWSSKAP